MKIQAEFKSEFRDGDIITSNTQTGNTYLVDNNKNLSPLQEFNQKDFKEGVTFVKIANVITDTNQRDFFVGTGTLDSELLDFKMLD